MRNIPTERVQFLTVPRESYAYNANRDQLVEPAAEKLFERLRMDTGLEVAEELPEDSGTKSGNAASDREETSHEGGEERAHNSPNDYGEESYDDEKPGGKRPVDPVATPEPAPTFHGNTAADDTCE
jgi:hypothetical protein